MMGWGFMGTGGLAMILVWSIALLLPLGTAFGIVVLLKAAAHRHNWTPPARRLESPRVKAEDELELRYALSATTAATTITLTSAGQRAVAGAIARRQLLTGTLPPAVRSSAHRRLSRSSRQAGPGKRQ
jgi:hypothetical protein